MSFNIFYTNVPLSERQSGGELHPLPPRKVSDMKIASKTLIQIIVVVIVVGALLHHNYPIAGLSVALAAIGLYLLRNLRTCIRDIRRFKQLIRTAKVRLVTFTALLYILIHALVTGTIPYFLLLMMLGIDYLIYDNQPPK